MQFIETYRGWDIYRIENGKYKAICQRTGSTFTANTRADLKALIAS